MFPRRATSPLKNAFVTFFNLAKGRSEAARGSQNNDLRRHFGHHFL